MLAKQKKINFKRTFPASKRIFKKGEDKDSGIFISFRKTELSDTQLEQCSFQNKPVVVYDTAGPYYDDSYEVDINHGFPKVRDVRTEVCEDVEHYEGRRTQSIDNGFSKEGHKNHAAHLFEY